MKIPYQPYYCEENIWILCHEPHMAAACKRVVFVSNTGRAVPMWASRAAPSTDQPVIWDYHVFLLCRDPDWRVWDPDCLLPSPLKPDRYLAASFPHPLAPIWEPMFRVVAAECFVDLFSSDRSHMRDKDGTYSAPPPPWPPIFDGRSHNLMRFVDMNDPIAGDIFDFSAFKTYLRKLDPA